MPYTTNTFHTATEAPPPPASSFISRVVLGRNENQAKVNVMCVCEESKYLSYTCTCEGVSVCPCMRERERIQEPGVGNVSESKGKGAVGECIITSKRKSWNRRRRRMGTQVYK